MESLPDIAFWCNEKGVSARQQLTLKHIEGKWHLAQQEETVVQPRSDEKRILSHIAVLEGAPALSENWSLFESNEDLFHEARITQAATLIFSLMQNNQIETLARQIHTLRRQRGSALKIIVRENNTSLRATDERLLLGCGANMVIPWNAPLSRCLTLIESVQGQQFSRHVPEDISTLLYDAADEAAWISKMGYLLRRRRQYDEQYASSCRRKRGYGCPASCTGYPR